MSELEKQKIKTQFQFNDTFLGEQTHEFEHTVLEPQNLQREVETIRFRENAIQGLRAAIYSQALPAQQAQQVVRPAERQPAGPEVVQEKSWKERRAERKQKEKNLKRAKKLTQYGDELTADLVEQQQVWDGNVRGFRDFGYARDDISEELVEVLRSMENVRVTADLFTDENYVRNYAFLKETVEKGNYLARIAGSESHMKKLDRMNHSLYRTALYWQGAAPLVRQMMEHANRAHGLDEDGTVLAPAEQKYTPGLEPGHVRAIAETRSRMDSIRDQFRDTLSTYEQEYREAVLQEEYEKELSRQKNGGIASNTEERDWLQSPSLTYGSGEAYESLQEIKTLIEQSNEIYLANQPVVDKMYSDIIRRFEVLGELTAQRYAWIEVQSRYQHYQNQPGSDGNKLWRETNRKLDQLIQDGTAVAENLSTVRNALTRLLEGKLFNPLEVATLESYGYHAAADMEVATAPLREQATARTVRSNWQNDALNRLLGTEEHPGVFRPANPDSVYVTRTVTLFEQGDDAYNLELLETLQPFEKELNRKRPTQEKGMSDGAFRELVREDTEHRKEYYEKIRGIVEPQVARIMTWEMDRFLQMSEEELIGAQKELDDLFGSNMFTADLMKLKHPKMESRTMKEDILGDRLEEFSHRLAVLRALTDKSRGLALRKLGEQTILKPAYFGTDADYGKLGDGSHASCLAFAKQQIESGERRLQVEQARWEDKRDIHSEAFKTACMAKYQKAGKAGDLPMPDSPLNAVQARYIRHFVELQPDATQVEKDVLQRLMKQHYRPACWDQEDAFRYAREHGVEPVRNEHGHLPDIAREDMGESIFRVFTSYIRTPGAQTQSPEDFQQMLRELSAGAQLQRGVSSDREIFEAREQNRQGCLRFKESLRVSYEYLSRKYGFGLETLTALEIYDHWEEILGDFGNVQVEMNFISRVPGIIDMENQEDKALFHQVNYLSLLSQSVQNLMLLVGAGAPVDDLMEQIRSTVLTGYGAPHREALKEMGVASGMSETVRWEQTVGKRRPLPVEPPEAKEARWQKFRRDEEARREMETQKAVEAAGVMFQQAEEAYEAAEEAELEQKTQESAAELFRQAEEAYEQKEEKARLEKEAQIEWETKPKQVTKRVEDKLKKLSFDQFPQRTKGMKDGKTRFNTGWHRRDGLERGEYMAPSDRIGMAQRVMAKFQDAKRYGDAMSGGLLGDLGNATGISFSGLKAPRLLTNLEGALGQGYTEEQIISMYEKLMISGRYRLLKTHEESGSLTEEEKQELNGYDAAKIQTMDDTFAEGIQELKQIQLAQLRRLRDKYGRFGSQLHPEDFARRMGLEFFDDFMLDQDMVQVLQYGQQYFDFENNAEDREFRDLVQYYSSVYNILFTYFGVPEDQYEYAMTVLLPGLRENQTARELENVVGGDGFTVQEQAAYRQDLEKRAGKQGIQLFGRFKENA